MKYLSFKKTIFLFFFTFALVSFSQEGKGRGTITVSNKKDTIKGIKRALIIGISDYSSSNLTLKYADDDAELFKSYLIKIEKVKEENITLLTNKNANSFNILTALKNLIENTRKNDNVYLFFAGHGDVVDKDNIEQQLGFLLAYDVNQNREFYGTQGVIPFDKISNTVNKIANKEAKITLILDACRSGYLSADGAQNNLKTFNKYLENSTKLLSCNPNELSYEGDNLKINEGKIGHGYFTYYLVLGLMGAADNLVQDNKLQSFELQMFLNTTVNSATNNKQTPIVKSKSSTDVFKKIISFDKKEALKQIQNPTGIKTILASRANSKGNDTALDLDSELIKQYNTALANKNFYGKRTSAFETIKLAVKDQKIDGEIIQLMKNKLVVALSVEPQLLINDYIGNIEKLPNGNIFQKNAKNLEICLKLMEKDNFSYDRILTSKLFLEAYAIIKNKHFNKYPIAKRKLNEALLKEKKAAYIYNALGIVLNYEENYKESEKNYKKASELIPSWYYPINNLGINYYEKSDYFTAKKYYNQILSKDPKNRSALNNLGAVANDMGRYQEAEEYYHKVKKESGEYLSITLRNLGKLYKNKGNIKKAEYYFLKALKKDSTDINALLDYADVLIDENINPQKAIGFLKKAITLEPYLSRGYAEYASFLRRYPKNNKDLKKSDSLFKIAIKNNPFYTWSYASRGWLYNKQKEVEKALNSFKKGITNNPLKASSYYYLANFYDTGLKNKILSKQYFEKALQIDSFYMPAYRGLISLLNSEKKHTTSFSMLEKIIDRNKQAPDMYNLLGNTYFDVKNYKKAIFNYKKAIEVDSTYAKGYSNLAYSLLKTGEYQNATDTYKKAVIYNPYKNNLESFASLLLTEARREKRKGNFNISENILFVAVKFLESYETTFALTEHYYFNNKPQKAFKLLNRIKLDNLSKTRKIKFLELITKISLDLKMKKSSISYFNKLKSVSPRKHTIIDALVKRLNKDKKGAQKIISEVNSFLLKDKYLSRKFSVNTITIIKSLKNE